MQHAIDFKYFINPLNAKFMKKIGNIIVKVTNGNIAKKHVDCIVVPQFSAHASCKTGVGKILCQNGMEHGMLLYDFYAKHHVLHDGDVWISISGKNNIQLAHVVTADSWRDEEYSAAFKAVFNTLVKAAKKKWECIAIPEIGTGIIGNLTQRQSAHSICAAIYQFTQLFPENNIKSILLVIDDNLTEPADEVLELKLYETIGDEVGQCSFDAQAWLSEMGYAK